MSQTDLYIIYNSFCDVFRIYMRQNSIFFAAKLAKNREKSRKIGEISGNFRENFDFKKLYMT